MGGLLCKPEEKEDPPMLRQPRRRLRSRSAKPTQTPEVAAVLGNFDLLKRILMVLVPKDGCSVATRLQVAQVCKLWRDVSRTVPISLQLKKPLSDEQAKHLQSGALGGIRHIGFVGSEEARAHEILASLKFQHGSQATLHSISGLPFQDDMGHLKQFTELTAISLCRRNWVTLLELVRGTVHNMADLGSLRKLQSLTLKDLAGPQAALDLSHLPACLENLHLVNTSFVHHPEMNLPEGLHLKSLTATSLGRRSTIVPVELLRRTKQAILRGREVYLTGQPTDHPEIGEDSIEIIMNGGMLFLFGFGMPQVQHETNTATILRQLEDSDLQMLRLCTEAGGTAHLVERSDCRKGLRWKSLEVATPSHFMADISSVGEAPASGFGCKVEERHPDGSIHTLCLSRTGTPRAQADAAIQHLLLLQSFLMDQLQELEDHVRNLGQAVVLRE